MAAAPSLRNDRLCIGGPLSGQRANRHGPSFSVPITTAEPDFDFARRATVSVHTTVENFTYVEQSFHTPDHVFKLWVPSGQAAATTMDMLLNTFAEKRGAKPSIGMLVGGAGVISQFLVSLIDHALQNHSTWAHRVWFTMEQIRMREARDVAAQREARHE